MASFERPRRPASVTVLAILQLIVGVVGLVSEVLDLAAPSLLSASPGAPPAEILAEVPFFTQVKLAACVVGLVLSLVLIADGVGLLMLRRWAYNLGVVYAWLSIVYQVAWLAYVFLVAQPVILEALSNIPIKPGTLPTGMQPDDFRHYLQTVEKVASFVTGLGLIYPIFVLVMLAVTRKAFRREKWAPEGAVEVADAAPSGTPAPDDRLERGPR